MLTAEILPWQQTIWQAIRQSSIVRRHHALLLKGRRGIGKLSFARHLAKAALCEQTDVAGVACGQCRSCAWFEQGTHPNFRLLEPEAVSSVAGKAHRSDMAETKSSKKPSQQIGIASVRALDDFIYLSAHQNRYKVVLIHPAETMNTAAANGLLKKLEEPPAEVLFILVTHTAASLPATILSRCQQIVLPVPERDVALNWLLQQGITDAESRLAMFGQAPLLVLQQDDQSVALCADLIEFLCAPNRSDPVSIAEKLYKYNLSSVTDWLLKWCYDLLCYHATGEVRYHLHHADVIGRLAVTMDPTSVAFLWRDLIASQQFIHHPLNARLFIEQMLLICMNAAHKNTRGMVTS